MHKMYMAECNVYNSVYGVYRVYIEVFKAVYFGGI